MPEQKFNKLLQGSIALAIVFTVDLFVPLGVAVGVLYVCCIIFLLRSSLKHILIITMAATALTLIALLFTLTPDTTWMAYTNRGISIIAIWIAAMLAIKNQQLDEEAAIHLRQLEQKNRDLEQFAYVASHDLQEPLRTVTSFTDLLSQEYRGKFDKDADKYFRFITDSVQRMQTLIHDLLEYSRIGKGKAPALVDCAQLIENTVLADLDAAITENDAEVHFSDLPTIFAYPDQLRMLFQNLISNALKFRNTGVTPKIQISAIKKGEYWQFSVRDNGIGIDMKYKDIIFVIFQRLHNRNEYSGSGIGLSHCKKIIDIHGGRIWFDSMPGEGTTFHFTIPGSSSSLL